MNVLNDRSTFLAERRHIIKSLSHQAMFQNPPFYRSIDPKSRSATSLTSTTSRGRLKVSKILRHLKVVENFTHGNSPVVCVPRIYQICKILGSAHVISLFDQSCLSVRNDQIRCIGALYNSSGDFWCLLSNTQTSGSSWRPSGPAASDEEGRSSQGQAGGADQQQQQYVYI